MKKRPSHIVLGILVVTATVVSFVSTRAAQRLMIGQPGLGHWLDVPDQERRLLDQTNARFHSDVRELASVYDRERERLAVLVADSNSLEDQIQAQARAVIEGNNALARRVLERVLVVREHLTQEPRHRFARFCGSAVRGQGRRHRNRSGPERADPRGQGRSRGPRPGRRHMRGQQGGQSQAAVGSWQTTGLSRHLKLTNTQLTAITNADPDFAEELDQVTRRVEDHHLALSQRLEDTGTSDETAREHLEIFISARAHLEQRAVNHVLRVRHLLTPGQKRKLSNLCADGMDSAGAGGTGLGYE